MDTNAPTLFTMVPRCFACDDTGFELSSEGIISTCWRVRAGAVHNEPSEAAKMIARATHHLMIERVAIDRHVFDIAKTLARHTSAMPCKRDRLIDIHFGHSTSDVRNCAAAIETLRKVWLLPVGSRKESPSGYWIITETADFHAWVIRAKAAPITQLTTIHRVAKRNFPVFAEQMELDFFRDMQPQPLDAMAA